MSNSFSTKYELRFYISVSTNIDQSYCYITASPPILTNHIVILQEVEVENVFKICLHAETTKVSVHTYRERQRHLQKLDFTTVQNSLPSGPFSQVIIELSFMS